MNKLLFFLKKATPILLTCLSAAGTVATAVLAVRETPKALRLIEEAKQMDEDFSTKDALRLLAPVYLPAAAVCAGTLLCSFGACALSWKQQASLASAYALLQQSYNQYKNRIVGIVGKEADHIAEQAMEMEAVNDEPYPWDEPRTFYLEPYGKFFERTMEQVFRAEYHINRNMAIGGAVTLNEFLDFLDLEHVADGDVLGWDQYEGETSYGYRFIDFEHRAYQTDDGMTVYAIDMPFPPHLPEPDMALGT